MGRIIPKTLLDEIRDRNDIADLIGSYVTLKRAGGRLKALCPFHKEKTPSFVVNPDHQNFHCFGCGVGGDVFAFVMQHEGVDFLMSAKILAQRAGVTLELEEDDGKGVNKAALYKIHEEIALFYQRCLHQVPSAKPARDYLAARDLDETIQREFGIGYAPRRWDTCETWAAKQKHSMELMEQSGLIARSDKPNAKRTHYDRFRGRLMFPIRDEQSRVIGFSGRLLDADAKAAKYVNSPETPLFRKSRVLYALDMARRPIVDAGTALICEGQIDVIRCHQAGFPTAVAAQGTAFTEEHARTLRRYADSIIICFDADKAGQAAAIKAASVFMAGGLAVRIALLPDTYDPDLFIQKHGAEQFQQILDKSHSAVSFQIEVLGTHEDLRSEVGVMRASRQILETIGHSPNAVQRAKLVQEASAKLHLPASALQDDLRHLLHRQRFKTANKPTETVPAKPTASEALPKEEVELCEHVVHITDHPGLADQIRKYLPLQMLRSSLCQTVTAAALEAFASGARVDEVLRDKGSTEQELFSFVACVQNAPFKAAGTESSREFAVQSLILFIWAREMKDELERLRARGPHDLSPDERERFVQIPHYLRQLKQWETGSEIIAFEIALQEDAN